MAKKCGGLKFAPSCWPYTEEELAGLDEAQRAYLRDRSLVSELLVGRPMVDDNGEPRTLKLVEPGTEREQETRAALARMLRRGAPLDKFIRNHLADLIDPDGNCAQELVLKTRNAGHSQDLLQVVHVRRAVADEIEAGTSVKAALNNVAELFGISAKTAKRIWYQIDG
jgi:hypothetical protein